MSSPVSQASVGSAFPGSRDPGRALASAHRHHEFWATGNGIRTEFFVAEVDALGKVIRGASFVRADDVEVYVAGTKMRPDAPGVAHDFKVRGITAGYDGDKNAIKLAVAPGNGVSVCIRVVAP